LPAAAQVGKTKVGGIDLGKLREECAKIGPNPAEIELSAAGRLTPDLIRTFQDMGVSRAMTIPPGGDRDSLSRGRRLGKQPGA